MCERAPNRCDYVPSSLQRSIFTIRQRFLAISKIMTHNGKLVKYTFFSSCGQFKELHPKSPGGPREAAFSLCKEVDVIM